MNDGEKIVAVFVNYDGVIPAYSYTYEEIADHLAKMDLEEGNG